MKKLTNKLHITLLSFVLSRTYLKSKSILKNFILSFIMLFFFCSSTIKMFGQESLINKIYLQSAGGGSSYKSNNTEVGIKTILKNNWSTTLSYHQIETMIPKNQPSDYRPESGTSYIFYIPIPYTNEPLSTKMNIYSLTAGKYFPLGHKIWFTTEAGISLVKGEKVTYRPSGPNNHNPDIDFTDNFITLLFGIANTVSSYSNYSTSIENKTTIGGMLRADINWAFSSFMGLGVGVFANFNSIQSPVGYNIKLTIGWMNRGEK